MQAKFLAACIFASFSGYVRNVIADNGDIKPAVHSWVERFESFAPWIRAIYMEQAEDLLKQGNVDSEALAAILRIWSSAADKAIPLQELVENFRNMHVDNRASWTNLSNKILQVSIG